MLRKTTNKINKLPPKNCPVTLPFSFYKKGSVVTKVTVLGVNLQ